METVSLGAGLASLAFWGFIAAVSVAGIWDGVRKREAKHETVRRLVEGGKDIDPELIEKILDINGKRQLDIDFKVTALWILPVAVGMVVLAVILGWQFPVVLGPLLGVAGLLFCLGIGFLLASKVVANWSDSKNPPGENN